MKKIFSVVALCASSFAGFAQASFDGDWNGKINVGADLRVVFHITKTVEGYKATMDSPDQGAKDIPASTVNVKGNDIEIEVAAIRGKFVGKLTDAQTITGNLQQGQMSIPLNLSKGALPVAANRPQTPVPPFSYTSEDVSYTNTDKSITYGATLTLPKGEGPFPAVLLITGSGPQNRDEEIFEHKPFAVIADYLTNNGYAVLRVDDRGIGKTTGKFSNATTEDFVQDATTSFKYLQSRKEINGKKIGVLGHSEGGLIAEILAAQNKDVAFAVLMAAPGIKTAELMKEQNEALMLQRGLEQNAITEYLKVYKEMTTAAANAKTEEQAKADVVSALKKWQSTTDPQIVQMTAGLVKERNEEIEKRILENYAQGFSGAWMRKFLAYDPSIYLKQTNAKILALNGSKDVQVKSSSNLEGIKKHMKSNASNQVKELEGLNHLFQSCSKCTVAEYGELTETISPVALESIKNWLDKEVK